MSYRSIKRRPVRAGRVVGLLAVALVVTTRSLSVVQARTSPQVAKYIILLISDGWGINHLRATNDYAGTVPAYQRWTQYWMSNYPAGGGYDPVRAWSEWEYVLQGSTDSAASSTALSSGVKTDNGRISVSPTGKRLFTLADRARMLGKGVGAVTSVWVSQRRQRSSFRTRG